MCKYIHYNVGLKYMFGGFFPSSHSGQLSFSDFSCDVRPTFIFSQHFRLITLLRCFGYYTVGDRCLFIFFSSSGQLSFSDFKFNV